MKITFKSREEQREFERTLEDAKLLHSDTSYLIHLADFIIDNYEDSQTT